MPAASRNQQITVGLIIICLGVASWVLYSQAKKDFLFIKSVGDAVLQRSSRLKDSPFLPSDEVLKFWSEDEWEKANTTIDDPALIQYIRGSIVGPSQKPRTLMNEAKVDYSQVRQSAAVDRILNHRRGGFFVECGAADGEKLSNTLYFEKELDWTGLLVEPNYKFYQSVLSKNRNVYSLNACMSASTHPSIQQFNMEVIQLRGHIQTGQTSSCVEHVHCYPFYSIMLALGVNHIDYFSLDVEGFELAILKTIPFEKIRIDVFTVEYFSVVGNQLRNVTQVKKDLEKLRVFFKATGLYEEAGILEVSGKNMSQEQLEELGLDVIFRRKDLNE